MVTEIHVKLTWIHFKQNVRIPIYFIARRCFIQLRKENRD